jgi:hypothetical protein
MIPSFSARHAMVSFERPDQLEVAAEICQSITLDNGAFSAWRQKKKYDFEGYAAWAKKWLKHPCVDWCIIPDVIDGTEEENDAHINAWPLPVELSVPVWHMHESMERLTRLIEFPRIALGSSGQFSKPGAPAWWERMAQAMDIICDADGFPVTKVHGLRMLDPGIFSKLPFSSADSCNVARNVGIDKAWKGSYLPHSKLVKAIILMGRIESHASAHRWERTAIDAYHNANLIG